jgi:MFS family permease
MHTIGHIGRFLGLKRNLVLFLGAAILIGAGEETWMRFVPKYLELLGAGAVVIGLYDALKTLLGAIYAYPGGLVVDRWGHRRALVEFTLLSIAGYALVLFVPHAVAVLGGMFLFLAWSSLSLPAMFSLVASTLSSEKHTMGIGVQSMTKRIPVIIGPVVGGLLMDRYGLLTGFRIGLVISIFFGALSMWMQSKLREETPAIPKAPGAFLATVRSFDSRLKLLLFSDILIRFCERIPYAWVVIYAMDNAGATATQVGVLIAVETIVAMACYVPVARLAERYGKEPFVIVTFFFFTIFPLTLLAAHRFETLLIAFAVRGLKEFGDSPRKALIIEYSNPQARGRSIGAYYLIRDVIVSVGALLGAGLWKISPQANFLGAALLGVLGTALYIARLRSMQSGAPARS